MKKRTAILFDDFWSYHLAQLNAALKCANRRLLWKNERQMALTIQKCTHMYECMRTTLVLDDPIFEKAKKKSAEMGVTLSELTTTALRNLLYSKGDEERIRERFIMPVVGEEQEVHQTPQELARLRDECR